MLPKRSDCYLHSLQCHDDLPKEALRQMMLNQESIFRKQVQELHRLYQIQMILMKNLRLKEVTATQSVNYSEQQRIGNWSRCMQMPLDVEEPASFYVNYTDEHLLKSGNGWGTSEMPLQVERYCPGGTESSLDEVKLSLSIGWDTSWKRSGRKNWVEKVTPVPSQQIIDLEESTGTVLSIDVEGKSVVGCTACSPHSGDLNGFLACCSCTTSQKNDLSNWTRSSQSLIYENTNCPESSLNKAVKKQLGDLPAIGISVGKTFTSHEVAFLDLNKPQVDEDSSSHLNDCIRAYSYEGASSDVSEGLVGEFHEGTSPDLSSSTKPNVNCSNEVSTLLQHDTLNSVVMASSSTDNSTNMSASKLQSIDRESCCMSPSDQGEDHDCLARNPQHKDAELGSNFSSRNSESVTTIEVNDLTEEVTVASYLGRSGDTVEDVNIDRSPASSKSDQIAADPSSSLKTMESGTYVEKSLSRFDSFQNSEFSQVESSGIDESKSRSPDENEGGSAHYDALIQRGAVSLIYFTLQSSKTRENDCIAEIGKTNMTVKEKRDQPECSLDSFESIVLKLPESNGDDYSVTSNAYDVNDMDKKDSGIKLRRGRRLKDFQKDILPGMASLSRHEICEDIRIMEGVIRSREYKRLRSKMDNGQNWFTPVRSRRSRLNYTGRRYYK